MEDTVNHELIYEFLIQYGGGGISLMKDYWEEGIAFICIDHKEKRNALSGKMCTELRKCIEELENWKTGKAVIMMGEGINFCSGADLDFVRKECNPTAGYYLSSYMHDILIRFRKLPLITVTLLHGIAVGGGAEISTYTDYLLVTDNARVGFVQGTMGIITAWGAETRLIQLIGQRKALEVLLSSKIYNAQELLDMGLAYKIVETKTMIEETLDFVRSLTTHHYSIIQSYKSVSNVALEKCFVESLNVEKREVCTKWGAELNREALRKRIKHIKDNK
ncbi:ethylmalonyl-CoA decarboxylase-like [Diorhabda carinulata]|uniref:ethylmalonyl-CoA decarboxylase-like n=1 Tax=Diorhabda carinulata TaxID=1163345 RepID=UPI0025A00CAB|nr:ethylmalonyl-CoA decarboxylase-like [Diorhabda carinulata]